MCLTSNYIDYHTFGTQEQTLDIGLVLFGNLKLIGQGQRDLRLTHVYFTVMSIICITITYRSRFIQVVELINNHPMLTCLCLIFLK